jgi:hypothetical protein
VGDVGGFDASCDDNEALVPPLFEVLVSAGATAAAAAAAGGERR